MVTATQIKCPNCGTSVDVQDILAHQLEEEINRKCQSQMAADKGKFDQEQEKLNKAKAEFEQKKKQEDELFSERVEIKLKEERKTIKENLKKKLLEENSEQFQALQKELNEKSEQVKELNRTKAEIETLKREKSELKEAVEAEAQKKLNEILVTEKDKIRKAEEDKNELRFKELQKQLDDQKRLTDEMKRKQEQGSMQLQGEVQEIAIEEILRVVFPFDLIEEVGKGIKGADVIHTVRNKIGVDCGKILYESKRTKSFSYDWIAKLKSDAVLVKADVLVIVTEALPEDMDRIGQKDGVWICSFNDFKSLILVLRDSLIRVNEAYSSQTNKGEKTQMLYDYLTGNEFRLQVGAIIEGFTSLQDSYIKEKRAMERIWKEREKQLEKVLLNTNHFIGSIKGIAGSSLPDLKQIGSSDNILELEE